MVMSSPDISTITEEYAQSNHSDDFDGPTEALTTSCSREAGTTKSLDKHEEDSLTSSYTDDFETVTKTSRPTPRSRSFNTSLGRSYCDDFESTTRTPRDVGAGTPTMADVHTARSIPSMVQSEDWESYSRTPRKAVRARSMELLTARSAASLAYSDDFETATFTGRTPPHSASESTESSEETVTVTERTDTESTDWRSSYTDTDEDTVSITDSDVDNVTLFAEQEFLALKLKVLQTEGLERERHIKSASPERSTQQGLFLRQKLQLLQAKQSGQTAGSVIVAPPGPTRRHLAEKDDTIVEKLGISGFVINKLKTENALERMKKMAQEQVHEPNKCPDCKVHVTEMALRDFARKKTALAKAKQIEERLANNIDIYGDPVTLMGQGLAELPRLSDDPKDIFRKLLHPWSSRIWGSKLLQEEEEAAERERTTVESPHQLSSGYAHVSGKRVVTLTCPRLADFRSPMSGSQDTVTMKCGHRGAVIDHEDTTGVIDVYQRQLLGERMLRQSSGVSQGKDRRNDPSGLHSEALRSDNGEGSPAVPLAVPPAVASTEKIPTGLEVPSDQHEFWRHYFEPLQSCPWFPQPTGNTQHV